MLDKTSNGIMFAVIGFGGFLGIGEKYHAVPWSALDYDTDKGGYVVPFTKEQLQAAPAYSIKDLTGGDGKAARDASYRLLQGRPLLVISGTTLIASDGPANAGPFSFQLLRDGWIAATRRLAVTGSLHDVMNAATIRTILRIPADNSDMAKLPWFRPARYET